MRHFAQAHGAGQTRTALHGVQHAQGFVARAQVVGPCHPLAQGAAKLRKQVVRFFFENREQVRIERINGIGLFVRDADQRRGTGLELRRQPGHRLQRRGHIDGSGNFRIHEVGDEQFRLSLETIQCRFRLGQIHLGAWELRLQNVLQSPRHRRIGILEKPGRELVQQTSYFLRRYIEHPRVFGQSLAMQLHVLQGLLQQPGNLGQSQKSDRGGTPAERMRQANGGV